MALINGDDRVDKGRMNGTPGFLSVWEGRNFAVDFI